jgi:hypothetical protein
MTREAIEDRLKALEQAAEQLRERLVELELDSGRQLLDQAPLEGESAAGWSAASAGVSQAWSNHEVLDAALKSSRNLLGGRRLRPEQLDELRALLDGSPPELVRRISDAALEAAAVVARITAAWEGLIPRLEADRRLLEDAVRLADELGERGRVDLDDAARRLSKLGALLTSDPLAVAPEELEAVGASIEAIRRDLDSTAELKRDMTERLASARDRLEQLRRIVGEAETAHAELLVKIFAADAPAPVAVDDELERVLDEITTRGGAGRWTETRLALEQWTDRIGALLADARRVLADNRAPIEARNQLRALLDAYRIKAGRLGLVEAPRMGDIFERARRELYNAPTDLALVQQLVRSYQDGLSGGRPTPSTPELQR